MNFKKLITDIKVELFNQFMNIRYLLLHRKRNRIKVMSDEETVDYLIRNRASICRFGDGELGFVLMYYGYCQNISKFQEYNEEMCRRMAEILSNGQQTFCLVALPGILFSQGAKVQIKKSRAFWQAILVKHIDHFLGIIDNSATYGDTNFTRFYITRKDKVDAPKRINHVRKIWDNANLLIVEGEYTRMGVGNDLYSNAASIRRILCPAKNAYSRYDEIISSVRQFAQPGDLILLALGMTATVMAYDLAKDGYWAIDLGHLDIEYEWMRMGATEKVPVLNKYTNEAKGGDIATDSLDEKYRSEIIARI
jgi:glycosyltransferase family protein